MGVAVRPRRRVRRTWVLAWALLVPSLVPLALFTYGPIWSVLWRSLQVRTFGRGTAFGTGNYAALWEDERFWRALGNTAFYAAGTIVPSLVLALLFALALREAGWVTSFVRTLLVLPMMVPLVAAAALFTFVFLPGAGLIDHYLGWVGLGAVNWLGDPGLALPSIIAVTVWKNTGYYMLFFLAGLAAVPQEQIEAAWLEGATAWQRLRHVILQMLVALGLYDTLRGVAAPYLASAFGVFLMRQTFRQLPRDYEEAAALDGASALGIIWHVLLPLARPGLAAFAVVSLTAHWNEYVWPLMATSSPRTAVLTTGLASFAGASESGGQWGVVAAGTALVAAPLLLLFVLFQRRIVGSFVFSGIK